MNHVTFKPIVHPVGLHEALGRGRWDWVPDHSKPFPTLEELGAIWDQMCMDHMKRGVADIVDRKWTSRGLR